MPDTTKFVPTEVWGIEKQLAEGESTVFKGYPNLGLEGGPSTSPQRAEAVNQVGHYQGAKPPGE